jgi:hypothetical protein
MPMYQLWRASDHETFEAEARDDQHAAAVFGEMLGIILTLKSP